MGFTTKSKTNTIITTTTNTTSINTTSINTSISDSWAMGFFFVFFPEEDEKKPSFPLSNLSTSTSSSISFKSITRSNSSHLLSKAQSTISICALLIFITLLLFTLSTFEPTSKTANLKSNHNPNIPTTKKLIFPSALQGMGSLYRRGTRAMNDLIVAHVIESVTEIELIYFLRLLHRSGVTSKTDILFILPRKLSSFDRVIAEENASFSKLLSYGYENNINYTSSSSTFDPNMFVITNRKEKESGETIWGRSKHKENVNVSTELTRLSYGSVLSFEVDELDPENSLSGFFSEYVPMSLRRWACYPMLLGRVRRNYKHIMIVDVKDHLVLGDSLGQLKNRTPETVIVTTLPPTRRKNWEKKYVNSGFVLGGARGMRRLTNAMLNEIVRGITQHKKRNLVSESVLFNQLVTNEFILKNVDLIVSGESTHELSSLTGLMNSKSGSSSFSISKFPIIRRGNSNLDVSYAFKKYLCSSPLDSIAYSDC